MCTLRAVDPLVIARNHVFPLRRAKAATCRISDTGRTTVSSQSVLQHMRGMRHIDQQRSL
jgi:hypothetical protein